VRTLPLPHYINPSLPETKIHHLVERIVIPFSPGLSAGPETAGADADSGAASRLSDASPSSGALAGRGGALAPRVGIAPV